MPYIANGREVSVIAGPVTHIGQQLADGASVVDRWLGVQYAEHPIFGARWRPAVDYTHPAGTFRGFAEPLGERLAYLNIWRPAAVAPLGGWPVVVWMHDAGQAKPDGAALAALGCLVVVVEYPSGPLGVFWAPSDGAPVGISHSFLASALRWINRRIWAFGGSRRRLTLAGGKAALLLSEDPAAAGLFTRAWYHNAGGDQQRWTAEAAGGTPGYTQLMSSFRSALQGLSGAIPGHADLGRKADHWYVDAGKVFRSPDGSRFVARGAVIQPSTYVLHEYRTDYRYRTRFGQVTRPDGTVVATGAATGISEPTYSGKHNWISAAYTTDQVNRMADAGINCVIINLEPACRYSPAYIDPIDGLAYPSEMDQIDQTIDAATARGMAVMLRQANDQAPRQQVTEFMVWLVERYRDRPNIWLNPANEHNCFGIRQPDGSLVGNPNCKIGYVWADDIGAHIKAMRGAGWTAPIVINTIGWSGDAATVLRYMDGRAEFWSDPNLIIGMHHYKRAGDPDFNTARRAETEAAWQPVLDSRYCSLVEECGPNNLGIRDLDPGLNPPNSGDQAEWAETQLYFQQFFPWLGAKIEAGRSHGFIAFNWGAYDPVQQRHRENSLRRVGSDNAWTGWGELYRDHYLTRGYGASFATLKAAIGAVGYPEAVRRHMPAAHASSGGAQRQRLAAEGVRVLYDTAIQAPPHLPAVPMVFAADEDNRAAAEAMINAVPGSAFGVATEADHPLGGGAVSQALYRLSLSGNPGIPSGQMTSVAS